MPLSRHFYSLDEVQSALYYSTNRNIPQETLFWSQELILSGCIGENISIQFESWLWNKGPLQLQWLINAWTNLASNELSEDMILLSTYQLCSTSYTHRDHSLWNILVLSASNSNIPDRVTPKTPYILPSNDEQEIFFIRAIFQGKSQSAWWISRYFKDSHVWILLDWYAKNIFPNYYKQYKICFEALQHYEQLLGYKSDEYDIIVRCLAILSLCLSPEKQVHSFKELDSVLNSHYIELLENISSSIGYKSRRIYIIPTECLYGTTLRGRSKWSQQNTFQLNNIEKHLIGCPFWDETLNDYINLVDDNGNIIWKSDDDMEIFYDKYFPDDIPDEWSKIEKQKSHGDGILGPNDSPNILKYSRTYLSKNTLMAWNTTGDVNHFLEKCGELLNECILSKISTLLKSPIPFNKNILKPVHRRPYFII